MPLHVFLLCRLGSKWSKWHRGQSRLWRTRLELETAATAAGAEGRKKKKKRDPLLPLQYVTSFLFCFACQARWLSWHLTFLVGFWRRWRSSVYRSQPLISRVLDVITRTCLFLYLVTDVNNRKWIRNWSLHCCSEC